LSVVFVLRIFAQKRVFDDRGAQIALFIAFCHTMVHCVCDKPACDMSILPYFEKYDRHTGILASGDTLGPRKSDIVEKISKDHPAFVRFLDQHGLLHRLPYILGDMNIGLDAKGCYKVGDLFAGNLSHGVSPFTMGIKNAVVT
jgi:hypothetical protein